MSAVVYFSFPVVDRHAVKSKDCPALTSCFSNFIRNALFTPVTPTLFVLEVGAMLTQSLYSSLFVLSTAVHYLGKFLRGHDDPTRLLSLSLYPSIPRHWMSHGIKCTADTTAKINHHHHLEGCPVARSNEVYKSLLRLGEASLVKLDVSRTYTQLVATNCAIKIALEAF